MPETMIDVNQLHNMDCIQGMERLQPESVDLAFADPPFNIGYKYDVYEDRKAADDYLEWTKQWGAGVVRALKPAGTFWLAIGDDFAAELKGIFQRDLGLICRSWVIWYYTFGVNCQKKFSRSHTHLFHFVKSPKGYTFNDGEIRVPSARQLVYADSRADNRGRLPDDTWILRPQDALQSFGEDEDVWYYPRVCGTFKERAGFHGCQMPEQLLGRIIKVSSNPGDVVLEPFGGSGTTLIVAKKLGRNFIGFELSKNYAQRIHERLKTVRVGESLSGAAEPKVSAPTTAKGKKRGNAISVALEPSPTSKVRATREDIDRGVKEAFAIVRDGWSADRVVVDPEFNIPFLEQCRRLGVPGTDEFLNRRLFAIRKSGGLKGFSSSRFEIFSLLSAPEVDRIQFAVEITLQKFAKMKKTLDDVLCDPKLASAFDSHVHLMIPKSHPVHVNRWLALYLRKRANREIKAVAGLSRIVSKPAEGVSPFGSRALEHAPEGPGLYWLWAPERNLYVGNAMNLKNRLQCQFSDSGAAFGFWDTDKKDLQLAFAPLAKDEPELFAHTARWITRWKPEGNYEKFAAAG